MLVLFNQLQHDCSSRCTLECSKHVNKTNKYKHILLITEIKVVLLLMSCLLFLIHLMVYQLSANNQF